MNKLLKTSGLISILLLLVITAGAQLTAPKYSNEFLAIGVGARGLGMSNALVTSVNDVTSGYWNPSGLLNIDGDLQVAAMHANYFANIAKYDYAAVGTRLDSVSALGFSVIRFGVDDIPNTTELIDADGNINYDRITTFSAADYAFLFSYARKMKVPGLRVGANAKVVYRKVGDFANAWGFGLDAGAQYDRGAWRFGLMARDITSTFNAWNISLDEQTEAVFIQTGNELPDNSIEVTLPRLILGAARNFELNQKLNLLTELNVDFTTDGKRNVLVSSDPVSIDPHFGLELNYVNTIFLRGGVGNFQYSSPQEDTREMTFQPNMGIGLRIKNLYLDYALTDIGDQSTALYSNVFSLKVNLFKGDS